MSRNDATDARAIACHAAAAGRSDPPIGPVRMGEGKWVAGCGIRGRCWREAVSDFGVRPPIDAVVVHQSVRKRPSGTPGFTRRAKNA